MKIILVSIIVVCSTLISKAQPGKYTGTKKGLIKTVYTDSRNIRPPAGWSNIECSVLNSIMTRKYSLQMFLKKAQPILFYSASKKMKRNRNLQLQMYWKQLLSLCRQNAIANPRIGVWVKQSPAEYLQSIKKAWWFNRNKDKQKL